MLLVNFITSESAFEYVWKGALFLIFLIFGWLLVRSVTREIEQREKLDKFAGQLAVTNSKLQASAVSAC